RGFIGGSRFGGGFDGWAKTRDPLLRAGMGVEVRESATSGMRRLDLHEQARKMSCVDAPLLEERERVGVRLALEIARVAIVQDDERDGRRDARERGQIT